LLGLDGSVEDSGGGRLKVRSSGHVYFLRPAQIRWIEANGDYVVVHVEKRKHLIRDTMLRMEQRLSEYGFKRIHRSAIVNLEFVSELISNDSGDYQVILTDGSELKLSRTYRDELYAALNA
jgi:two-component system LytT family response regulator